jgi:hypothetical protein
MSRLIASVVEAHPKWRVYGDQNLTMLRGKGLATEAASAWVHTAFNEFHIDRLGDFVHPGNVASIRVLEKLGFHTEGQETVMGMSSILFSLGAKDVGPVDMRLTRPMC